MRTYIPIHGDLNLTDEWWASKGLKLGVDVFYNAIRDGSGRYDGYVLAHGEIPNRNSYAMRSVQEAEEVLKLIQGEQDDQTT